MIYRYNEENIFAKILRGEIPNDTISSTKYSLAFRDIAPQVPEHILIIPKGPYVCFDHFVSEASDVEIVDFNKLVGDICEKLKMSPGSGGNGYRLISNAGKFGVQEVPHYHLHLLGGQQLGRMISKVSRNK